jgi:hypothetical protein
LHDGHVIGRIMLHPQVPEGRRGSGQSLRRTIQLRSTIAATQQHARKRWRISKRSGLVKSLRATFSGRGGRRGGPRCRRRRG